MIEIRYCPSSLIEGFDTYSPKAAKSLFGRRKVNPILSFDIDEFRNVGEIVDAMHRISVSGVQEKFPAIINGGEISIASDNDRSTHILKPAPWDKTSLHVNGDDFGLDGGLSPYIGISDVYDQTGHPCRLDFERFGAKIGLVNKRIDRILNKYVALPDEANQLVDRSFLSDKLKRSYTRIVNERISRFNRASKM